MGVSECALMEPPVSGVETLVLVVSFQAKAVSGSSEILKLREANVLKTLLLGKPDIFNLFWVKATDALGKASATDLAMREASAFWCNKKVTVLACAFHDKARPGVHPPEEFAVNNTEGNSCA